MSTFDEILLKLKELHHKSISQKDLKIKQLCDEKVQGEVRQKRSESQILKLAQQINSLKKRLMAAENGRGGNRSVSNRLSAVNNVLVDKLTVENHLLFKKIGAEREAFQNRINQLKSRLEIKSNLALPKSYYDKELIDPKILLFSGNGNAMCENVDSTELDRDENTKHFDERIINDIEGHYSIDLVNESGSCHDAVPSQDVFEELHEEDTVDKEKCQKSSKLNITNWNSTDRVDEEQQFIYNAIDSNVLDFGSRYDGRDLSLKEMRNASQTPLNTKRIHDQKCRSDPLVKKRYFQDLNETMQDAAKTVHTKAKHFAGSELIEADRLAGGSYEKAASNSTNPLNVDLFEDVVFLKGESYKSSQSGGVKEQSQEEVLSNLTNSTSKSMKPNRDLKKSCDVTPNAFEDVVMSTENNSTIALNIRSGIPSKAVYSKTPISLNSTATFAFNQVTRNKISRKQMHGDDCPCCSEYYQLTKDLPRLNGIKAVQEVSRHRAWFKRPTTPPGFWDVDMASTQEIEERRISD